MIAIQSQTVRIASKNTKYCTEHDIQEKYALNTLSQKKKITLNPIPLHVQYQ